jgi:adenosylhomocysteine nucleosidase
MIAVTFALPTESSDFVRLLRNSKKSTRNGVPVIYGEIAEARVEILYTGVGAKTCRSRLEDFLSSGDYQSLISAGFAGGTTDKIDVADLVLGENFSLPVLLNKARQLLPESFAHVGKLLTVDTVIDSGAERNELASKTGAIAVDMETACIAQICATRGLPMLSLRAITDTPGNPFPLPPHVLFDLDRQQTRFSRLAFYLATHPGALFRLISFARHVSQSRAALANALDLLVRIFVS